MVKKTFAPERGDLIWLNFHPQAGHEQSGRRPALVVSSVTYNRCGLLLCCPITSQGKGYPFEVPVKSNHIRGVVLADHLKNQDWKFRKATFIGRADSPCLERVTAIIATLLVSD